MSDTHITEPDNALIKTINLVLDALAMLCRIVTGFSLVFLTVIFGWLVYGRYVLNSTPTWVEQAALLLVMVIAFLGAAVGVHDNTHLAVTLLRSKVPQKIRALLLGLVDVMLASFGLLMLIYGYQLTLFKWGSMIPLIHLPEGLRSLPLTISGGLILLFSLGHLLRLITGHDTRTDSIE